MSDEDKDTPAPEPSTTDTDFFTDAGQLETGAQAPPPDPDRPPPVDTIDDAPAGSGGPAPDALRDALAGDAAAPSLAALDRLARSGRLTGALAQSLATFAGRARAPALALAGIDPGLVLGQLVRHVDDPLRVTQGRGRGTCGAATMEYILLRTRPAEVVRLVDGLTGLDGKVKTLSGSSLELPASALGRDDSGRVDLDRLFQSALMSRAATNSWLFDYDNTRDNDTSWSEVEGNSRMALGGFTSLFGDVTGVARRGVATASPATDGVAAALTAAVQRGERVAVLTMFTAAKALHWLTVEKMDAAPNASGKRGVYLRNPWGEDDCDGPPERWPLPDGGGRIAIEREAFFGILRGVVLDR